MTRETIPAFFFESEPLARLAGAHRERFAAARPFPHAVFDGFLPADVSHRLVAEFPGPEAIRWASRDFDATTQTRKLSCSDETQFAPFLRHLVGQLLSHTFVRFLEQLTGVTGIITDPSHNECGLHSTGPGGKLAVHTDLNRHPVPGRLHQHLNVLLYLNEDWREEYGGHLELWDPALEAARQRILPVANRMVVFETGQDSFHGHPQPLACPADRRRNSIALYYYTLDRPAAAGYAGMQGDVNWVATQPDEKRIVRARALRRWVRAVTPPVVLDVVRKWRRKRPE